MRTKEERLARRIERIKKRDMIVEAGKFWVTDGTRIHHALLRKTVRETRKAIKGALDKAEEATSG